MTVKEDIYWNSFLSIFFDRIGFMTRKNMTEIVEDRGLKSAHAIYLIALYLQDGQTLMSLSKFLDMDPANTNRVMKTLKDDGLIYDDRKSATSKKYLNYLTEEGRVLAEEIMDRVTDLTNSYFDGIPREDILNMRNTLVKILQNMDKDLDKYLSSQYDNPYYTHLQTIPLDDDYPAMPKRLK